MQYTENKTTKYIWVLLVFIMIGLFSGIYLVEQRNTIERAHQRIENIVDFESIQRSAAFEKVSEEETYKAVKESGVTAMAIYDTTLKKLMDTGDITVLPYANLGAINFYGESPKAGMIYIFSVDGKYPIFQETWEALVHRLGADKVQLYQTNRGLALGLTVPYNTLIETNLGISRVQAQEVINKGFHVIVRPTNFINVSKGDIDFLFKRLEGLPNITGMIFVGKEVLGYPDLVGYTKHYLNSLRIPVVGIEATTQLQYENQKGFLDLAKSQKYSVGRVYTIAKDELKRLEPAEVAQRFYISDIERNIRFNLMPIYENGIDNQSALRTSLGYIKEATTKLEAKGYHFGRASIFEPYTPRLSALLGVMAGAVALIVFVGGAFFPVKHHRQVIIYFVLLALVLLAYLVSKGALVRQLLALSSAVLAPVGGMILLMNHWKARSEGVVKGLKLWLLPVVYLVFTALVAAVGGVYVASLLGSTDFFMEFNLFRGVKLTFILPVLLTAIAYLQRFPLWKGRTLNSVDEGVRFIKEFIQMDIKMYSIILLALLAVVAWIFVGRSGHTAGVPVPAAELALRRFLEDTLYARPREKEFLIGHPALMMATYAFFKRWPMFIHFALTVAGVIGVGSLVETFAHIRTPVFMSIMRGIDGVLMGIIFGILGIIVLRFLEYGAAWYNKQGAQE